ncbi:MAG TPA: hypothetical protein PKE55_10700 [Kiritimatiellia bacterium]|nr:hypothetical protein [Kiritimatiellia bacterium]
MMKKKKKKKVKPNNEFLYWSIAMFLLGLWALRDGWFPTQNTIASKTEIELARFVLFNKSLTYVSMLASAVLGVIHWKSK